MSDIFSLKVEELTSKIKDAQLTSVEICEAYLERIKKFEKDYDRVLEYRFLKSYPLSINTMPVTYETSQLLKCTVNFNFSRYVVETMDNTPEIGLPYFPDGVPVMGPLPLNNPPTGITLNV